MVHEGGHRLSQVLQSLKDLASDDLLFEGLEKSLGDTIGLGFSDEAEDVLAPKNSG